MFFVFVSFKKRTKLDIFSLIISFHLGKFRAPNAKKT